MDTQEKKDVLKAVKLLRELAGQWSRLPSDIRDAVGNDLQEISGVALNELADRLHGVTKARGAGQCDHCGKYFRNEKPTGRIRHYCDDNCRVQAHNARKEAMADMARAERKELKAWGDEWLGGAGEVATTGNGV
jgi:hypothetical protein